MKTYFKKSNFSSYLLALLGIGFTTVSCTSVNSGFYDTDGIYNTGKIKAPITHNETAYYQEYFEEKQNTSFETFTDIDSYSSYENGNYPGWGENNTNTNIYLNSGFGNPYWGWNYGFGYNNYFGWNYGFGFGGYYGWGNPYFGGGWGYPYYGNGWGYPYYGYGNNFRRNVSYSNNTRTIANISRNTNSLDRQNNTNITRSNRNIIQNSRETANRLDPRSNINTQYRDVKTTDLRNSNIRNTTIRNNETRQINNSTPTRNSNFNTTPIRTSNPAPRVGGSSSGSRISTGRR